MRKVRSLNGQESNLSLMPWSSGAEMNLRVYNGAKKLNFYNPAPVNYWGQTDWQI